jgi:hypothetical protein
MKNNKFDIYNHFKSLGAPNDCEAFLKDTLIQISKNSGEINGMLVVTFNSKIDTKEQEFNISIDHTCFAGEEMVLLKLAEILPDLMRKNFQKVKKLH